MVQIVVQKMFSFVLLRYFWYETDTHVLHSYIASQHQHTHTQIQTKNVIKIYFQVSGIILQITAIRVLNSYDEYFEMIDRELKGTPYILIGFGFLILVIGLFGVYVANKYESILTWTFAIFVGIVILIEFLIAIDELQDISEAGVMLLKRLWRMRMNEYKEGSPDILVAWDELQQNVSEIYETIHKYHKLLNAKVRKLTIFHLV